MSLRAAPRLTPTFALAFLLAGSSCGPAPERNAAPGPGRTLAVDDSAFAPLPQPPGPAAHAGREGRTEGDTFLVRWTPVPDPIPLNALFGMVLHVPEASGAPAPDVTLVVDAGMPGHGHGMTVRPRTTVQADGSFRAEGLLFHMPGAWVITTSVTRAGVTEVARFAVDVK